MSAHHTRFSLLMQLAWHVNELDCTVLISLPRNGETVLWAQLPDGHRFAVMAVERRHRWCFVWGGFISDGEHITTTARRISDTVRHIIGEESSAS